MQYIRAPCRWYVLYSNFNLSVQKNLLYIYILYLQVIKKMIPDQEITHANKTRIKKDLSLNLNYFSIRW